MPDSQPEHGDAAIIAIAATWEAAWNAHDIERMAALVAPDVDFINVTGRWLKGAGEFSSWHDRIHRSHLRASRWTTRAVHVRPLQPGLALVHVLWTIAGERTPDDTAGPDRSGIFTWLMRRQGERWQIAAAHNTNLGDGVDDHRAHVRAMP